MADNASPQVKRVYFGKPKGSQNTETNRVSYTEQWQVILPETWGDSSNPNRSFPPYITEIFAIPALPQRGDVYAKGTVHEDPTAFLSSRAATMTEKNPYHWTVDLTYSSSSAKGSSSDPSRDIWPPTDRPVRRSLRYTRVERPLYRDRIEADDTPPKLPNGNPDPSIVEGDPRYYKPIVLPNGRIFRDVPSYQEVHKVYQFRKYLADFPGEDFDELVDAINDDTYIHFPAKTLKCIAITPEEEFFSVPDNPDQTASYWLTLFEYEYSPTPWNPTYTVAEDIYELEYTLGYQGYVGVWDPTPKGLRRIKDQFGKEITEPWLLDSKGRGVDPKLLAQAGGGSYTWSEPWGSYHPDDQIQFNVPYFVPANTHLEKDFSVFNPYLDLD